MEHILNYIWDNIEKILALITVIGSIGIFLVWLWKTVKKSNSDTLVEITLEDLEKILNDTFVEYKAINSDEERGEPLINITGTDDSIRSLPLALQRKQVLIEMIEQVLEYEVENIDETTFAEALTASLGDNFFKADEVFAKIAKHEKPNERRRARIALVRGAIAENQLRWKDAAEHYRDAARAHPCFETLIFAQKLFINMGSYSSALSFSIKAKKIIKNIYGENSEEYVIIVSNLAAVYQLMLEDKKAESIYLQVLNICKEQPAVDISLIANINNNLGVIYVAQKDYKKGLSIFKEVLASREKMLGKNHPDTASNINNIAYMYVLSGQYKKAETFYKKAIQIRYDASNEHNHENGASFNNLAGLYERQKRYDDAELCYQKAIKILENTLDSDHPTIKFVKDSYEIFKTRHR